MRIRTLSFFPAITVLVLLTGYVSLTAQNNVRMTVAVTNPDGSPVMNLTQPDFSIKDSGKVGAIESFAGPNATAAKPPGLSPDEYSNTTDAGQSGATFIVLDTIHTRYVDERDMRELILKSLARAGQARHPVTLGILSEKGLSIYHDLHSGSDVLLAGLVKAGVGGMKGQVAPAGVNETDVTAEAARLSAFAKGDQSNPAPADRLLRSNVNWPLIMYQDIAHAAYGLPGRKMLVWVTNAVPFEINPKTMMFQSTQESNRGVSVNGEAAGGMKNTLTDDQVKSTLPVWRQAMHDLFAAGVAIYPVEARNSFTAGSDAMTQARMKELALITGGKAFFGSNDPFPELVKMATSNTAGYTMTYTSDAAGSDFHAVQVRVSNTTYPVLQAAGYFPAPALDNAGVGQQVGSALQSPLEYTGLAFKVAVAGTENGAGGKKKLNLVITIPGEAGVVNASTGKADIGLVAIAKNAKGETLGKMNEGAGGQFPPEAVAQIKEMGFQLKRSFEVSPGESTVHFVIRDNQTGRMGSIIFPLKVQ
jgi:VWFA-related protein